MLGDNLNKKENQCEKISFISQFQDPKVNQIIRKREQEIKELKRTIRKLQKDQKAVAQKKTDFISSSNNYLTAEMKNEFKRFQELKSIVIDVTQRMRKLSMHIDSQYSLSQNSSSLQNMRNMLNFSAEQNSYGSSVRSVQDEEEQQQYLQLSRAFQGLQVMMKTFQMKFNQLKKERKNLLGELTKSRNQYKEELVILQNDLNQQRKKKEQLQKLLQQNQTEKNQLVNSLNNIIAKNQMAELQKKEKEQIIKYAQKLNYRIKDLQDQKVQYLKLNSKDKEKEMKLYEELLTQVKGIKQKSRLGKSLSIGGQLKL